MHLFSYIKNCSGLDPSVIIYDPTYSKFFGISQSPVVLFSPSVPIYVYIGFFKKGHTNYCVGSGIFDIGHIAMFILLLSFSANLLLWAFQKQMGFAFPFLNRFMYSRNHVLFQFSFIGSTHQLKSFPRSQ